MVKGKVGIFLDVHNAHSKNKNQDFRIVNIFTPFFTDSLGYQQGGVKPYFIPLDSPLGKDLRNGVPTGALVRPEFVADPYTHRMELVGLELVSESPYDPADFEG